MADQTPTDIAAGIRASIDTLNTQRQAMDETATKLQADLANYQTDLSAAEQNVYSAQLALGQAQAHQQAVSDAIAQTGDQMTAAQNASANLGSALDHLQATLQIITQQNGASAA